MMIWQALFLTLSLANQEAVPLGTVTRQVDVKTLEWDQAEKQLNPAIVRSEFLQLDSSGIAPERAVSLDLFSKRIAITLGKGKPIYPGYLYYQGENASLTVGPRGVISGSLFHDGKEFELVYTGEGNLHCLRELDASRQKPCGQTPDHVVGSSGGSGPPAPEDSSMPTNIDVCVFYTQAAASGAGGSAAMESLIVHHIGEANAAAVNSSVGHEFRLVKMASIAYAETGSSTDLLRFQDPRDGFMDSVHGIRSDFGGDLMNLIINHSETICGSGFVMSDDTHDFRSAAFNVTVRGCLSNRSMTHEMGHNMGSHHDRPNAGRPAYPYGYGWRTPDNRYRTIMAYPPGTRINKWSGPNVVHEGRTMGNEDNDNVRSLNQTRTTVQGFYAETVLFWKDIPGGIPGSYGKPTIEGKGTTNFAEPIEITLDNMPPGAPGILVIGFSEIGAPFAGGTLVPALDLTIPVVGSTDPIVLDGGILRLLAGTELWLQAFFVDAGAVKKLAASDGLKVRVP